MKELYDAFKHIIGNKGLKHIFQGEINLVGKASGIHHFSAIQEGTARLVGSKIPVGPPNSGIYKAVVEVKNDAGQWIKKVDANGNDQYSTFYPDNWDKLKVMEEIEHAANNRVGNFIENSATKQSYIGHTSDG